MAQAEHERCARIADAEAERWLKHLRTDRQSASQRMAAAARIITARHIAEQIRLLSKLTHEETDHV